MKVFYRPRPGADDKDVQEEIRLTFERLGDAAVTKLLKRVSIGTSTTRIAHGMGSVPNGWREFNKEGDARIWQSQAPDANNLYLQASVAVVAGIEVF